MLINVALDIQLTLTCRVSSAPKELTTSNTSNGGMRTYSQLDDFQFTKILSNSKPEKNKVTHCSYIMIDKYKLPNIHNLSKESRDSIEIENAGGKSDISEMFSIDYFNI